MKHIHDLMELFVEQLKEQYGGERQQLDCLSKLRGNTTNPELQDIIDHHIGKTRKQMIRLERVFALMGRNRHGENNLGVKGLVDEALALAERCVNTEVRDAGIITSVQHLNHHNIASYGTLHTYADELKQYEIRTLLQESLDEEKRTDQELSKLASLQINLKAI